MRKVAKINGLRELASFTFDSEVQDHSLNLLDKKDNANEYGVSDRQYYINVALSSVLFGLTSCSFYLIMFQIQYIGLNIFTLFYLSGVVMIMAGSLYKAVYEYLGLKHTILYLQVPSAVASLYLVLIQTKVIEFSDP